MSVIERVTQDTVAAMKAKDAAVLSTLRMLKSAFKNKQIDLMHELSEEEAMAVLKTQIKQLKDSVSEFEKAGRADLAEPAKEEVAVLERYLPAQMDDVTLTETVKTALASAGLSSKADMGRAMGVAVKAVAGQADGARIKAAVEATLTALALAFVIVVADPSLAFAQAQQDVVPSVDMLLPTLRIARSFLLLLGLAAVNIVLIGGFTFMVASGRDEGHEHGMEKMGIGVFATIAIALMFAIATNAIERLS